MYNKRIFKSLHNVMRIVKYLNYVYLCLTRKMKDKSLLLQAIGDTPKLRVIDFLITFQKFDYSLTDISEGSRVAYRTLMEIWPEIEEAQLVVETRKVGKSRMFKINMDNPIVKGLSKLQLKIADYIISKEFPKQKIKVKVHA